VVHAGTLSRPTPHIVEQRGCSHDLQIGILGFPNALRQFQHPQHVIEAVSGIGARVKTPGLGSGDHTSSILL
jgi:hypothetical protein